jgi:predicted esterase
MPVTAVTYNQITQKVCKADTTQSYAVYLPTAYTNQKKWPVIYLFDSHGGGQFAVEHFKEAAERFGYVVIGSNNSKNGLQTLDHTLDVMLNDAQAQYALDLNRQYAAGFSGGGRVALYLATKTGKIKGIITCGAGLPGFNPQTAAGKFDVFGIAGREDFNYDEVMAIAQQFDKTDWPYMTEGFDGGHEWPPVHLFTKALLWFQFNAMRDGLITKNEPLIEQEFDSTMFRIKDELNKKHYSAATNECKEGIADFDGLTNIKKLHKKLLSIQDKKEYIAEKQKEAQLKYGEDQLRSDFIDAFSTHDIDWWTEALENLSNKIESEPDLPTKQMLKRVKGFLGIICYSFTASAVKEKNEENLEKFIKIYQIAEPQNPDSYFYKAQLMEMQDNPEEAALALRKAMKLGFTDMGKIKATFSKKVLQLGQF